MNEQQTTALTDHVLAAGRRASGRSASRSTRIRQPPDSSPDVWDDYVTLVRLDVTVDDPAPPASLGRRRRAARRRLAPGDVCATLAFADAQSGLGSVWLASGRRLDSAWVAPRTGSQYQPGIAGAQPSLCLSAAASATASTPAPVGGADASGGQAAPLPFTVRVDRDAARRGARLAGRRRARRAARRRAGRRRCHERRLRGRAQIDGTAVPLDLSAQAGHRPPATALAYGAAHARLVRAGHGAATARTEARTSTCPTRRAPAFGAPQPADGAVARLQDDVSTVAVAVSDAGSGLDPASVAALARRQPHRARLAGRGRGPRHRRRRA